MRRDIDTYGHRVDPNWKRHPKCQCVPACQEESMYECTCTLHIGDPMTPYCNGCDDEADRRVGPICDTCWFHYYSDFDEDFERKEIAW